LVPIGIYVKNVIPDENPASSFKVDGFWKITFKGFPFWKVQCTPDW
jgi:hypothetical protein